MSYQGIAAMFVVGMGLAGAIYLYFAGRNQYVNQHSRQPQQRSSRSGWNSAHRIVQEEACIICFDMLRERACAMTNPCCHIFHESCIQEWMRNSKKTCPVCREDVTKLSSVQ